MPRTPRSLWGTLFNWLGGGLVHHELYETFEMSAENPTLFEAIAAYLLLSGTFAARPTAADVPLNAIYFATDTGNVYQNLAGTWTLFAVNTSGTTDPGGSDKNIQYNNADAFGGIANNATATKKYVQQVSSGTPSLEQVSGADLVAASVDAAQLANTAVTPAAYGDDRNVAGFIVDAQGRLTAAVDVPLDSPRKWVLLHDETISSPAPSFPVTDLHGFDEILIAAQALTLSSSANRGVQVSIDNGSNYLTTSGDYVRYDGNGTETAETWLPFHSTGTTAARSGLLHIHCWPLTTPKPVHGIQGFLQGRVQTTSVLNALRVTNNGAGNLTGGNFQVYGR